MSLLQHLPSTNQGMFTLVPLSDREGLFLANTLYCIKTSVKTNKNVKIAFQKLSKATIQSLKH